MDELIVCVAPVPGEKQEEKFPGSLDVADDLISSHDAGTSKSTRESTEVPHRPGGLPGSDLGTVLEGIGAGSGRVTG